MKNVGELFNNAHAEQKKVILSTVIKSFKVNELERKYRFGFGTIPKKTIIKAREIAKIKPGKHEKKLEKLNNYHRSKLNKLKNLTKVTRYQAICKQRSYNRKNS